VEGKVTGAEHLCRDNDVEVVGSMSYALNACCQFSNLVIKCFNIFSGLILELKGSDSLDWFSNGRCQNGLMCIDDGY